MTFRIGGGRGQATYAALCTADGKEVAFARGVNDQVMQRAEWDLASYVGQKMFIKVVDRSKSGWGHITVDDFQFDAKVLTEYPTEFKNEDTGKKVPSSEASPISTPEALTPARG